MLVKKRDQHRHWRPLGLQKGGRLVRFREKFHQSVRDDDYFLTVDDCAYRGILRADVHEDKVAVIRVRDGRLSMVSPARQVELVGAEIWIDE